MPKVRLTDVVKEAVERLGPEQAQAAFSSLEQLERLAPPVLAAVKDNAQRRNMSPEAVLKKFALPVVRDLLGLEAPPEEEKPKGQEETDRDVAETLALDAVEELAATVARLEAAMANQASKQASLEASLSELRTKVAPMLLQQSA